MQICIPFGKQSIPVELPDGVDILKMQEPESLPNPKEQIYQALQNPIGSIPLKEIVEKKMIAAKQKGCGTKACIVVSDNTRPVPYAGENGILKPILEVLEEAGVSGKNICILIACGTHRPMEAQEISKMIGLDIFQSGVTIVNHNCRDESQLAVIGKTERGTTVKINKFYAEADIKILTGLVESHFMAGVSGGRKSICPGIFGEEGTFVFHGPELMAHPNARDLVLEGNPVHEESLTVAKMAGADFIVNVTLDSSFAVTGIFCGDLEKAHAMAFEHLKSYVAIPIDKPYDLVITHGGFVALNHYQAAKAAVASIAAVKKGGTLIQIANNCDKNAIGSEHYRVTLSLLKLMGPIVFEKLLFSEAWKFVPDQWQVQLWTRVFKHVDMNQYIYYAPQLDDKDWRDVPGVDGRKYLPEEKGEFPDTEKVACVVRTALQNYLEEHSLTSDDIRTGKCRIAYLSEGPYGIPVSAR